MFLSLLQNRFFHIMLSILLCGNLTSGNASPVTSPYMQIEQLMDEATGGSSLPNTLLLIYDSKTDKLVFSHNSHQFKEDETIHIASATKWISAAVILRLVDKGNLHLEDTTSLYLKDADGHAWAGNRGNITLRQLLSFTSGLTPNISCAYRISENLQECVQTIYEETDDRLAVGGKSFSYGNTHLHVAAAMAEKATGKSWNELFELLIRQPLHFSSEAKYQRKRESLPGSNPLIAGGLKLKTKDYVNFLQMIDNNGVFLGKQILSTKMIEEMLQNQFEPVTTIQKSPFENHGIKYYRYGFGNWIECANDKCLQWRNSSPGLYGFYPWIDKSKGYYAILATRGNFKASVASTKLVNKMLPHIEALIRKPVN